MLATKFARKSISFRQSTPLDDDQLIRIAPSIFANDRHDSRSERYTYIATNKVIDGLRKEGFQPFFVAQGGSRIKGKAEFTKHMLRFRHASQINDTEANEIILINSHDGTSSYQMLGGVFRFVCQNGLVVGDGVTDLRIPHKGDIGGRIIEGAYQILDNFERIDANVEEMKALRLSEKEELIFAEAANTARLEVNETAPQIDPVKLLSPWRRADIGDDLWSTFNRTQENIIRGGVRGVNAKNERTRTREVKSIDAGLKINKALWQLAEAMKDLKKAA